MAESQPPTTAFFNRASNTRIGTGIFSSVHGVQNNYYRDDKDKKAREDFPQLQEFHEVKQGSIRKKTDLCEPWLLCGNRGEVTETIVYTAEIVHFGPEKFTVKAYNGRKAKKAWRRDFLKCSNDWAREIPLFGYSKSSVPLLIFHGELVPIAHIEARVGWVGRFYIEALKKTLGCSRNEVWMDPIRGSFCRGPVGPRCLKWYDVLDSTPIPLDVGFLKEDVIVRYFASTKNDHAFLLALGFSYRSGRVSQNGPLHNFRIVSSLTNSTTAFVRHVKWRCRTGSLDQREAMADGATRFRLSHNQCRGLEIQSVGESKSWLLQALRVFHTHNIGLDQDLSVYKLDVCYITLKGTIQSSKNKQERRRVWGPLYFFLLPNPSRNKPFYYWSYDRRGRKALSRDDCKYLGLPFTFSLQVLNLRRSWPTKVYKALHDYQVARGFDPNTTAFARYYSPFGSKFEIVPPENRLQEVVEEHDVPSELEQSSPTMNDAQGHQENADVIVHQLDTNSRSEPPPEDVRAPVLVEVSAPRANTPNSGFPGPANAETQEDPPLPRQGEVSSNVGAPSSKDGRKHAVLRSVPSAPLTRLRLKIEIKGKEVWRRVRKSG